jgi:hypothetical protein
MPPPSPSPTEVAGYYRAALACLRYVEARRPTKRRFGADADARWKAFRGHLATSDRIDLLLRDANAEWPGAFGAREVFGLPNVAEDEAFGAAWPGMDPVEGERLWRELGSTQATTSVREALGAVARAWGLTLQPQSAGAVDAAEKLIVVGPSAVASLAEVFAGRTDLDWAAQVTCVATSAAHRQLALAAAAVVDTHRPVRVLTAAQAAGALAKARAVTSDDASPEDLAVLSKAS